VRGALLLLLPLVVACGEAPEDAASVPGAIPPGSVPLGASERLAAIAPPGPPVTPELIAAGAEAYHGYCAPCHGTDGRGDGPVVEKGFPHSLPVGDGTHSPAEIVAIIGAGQNAMPPLATQVPPPERWAIAYYLTRERGGGE
jgi:mono/diheme cytochrome c family protein